MAQKPVAVIGTPGRVPGAFARPTPAAFAETGHNTGNLAFQHATWSIVADEKLSVGFDFDPAEIRERARLVCVPAANFLYSGFDLGGFADRLEATGLPLMVLGLGAQAMRDVSEVKLQAGTERLLRLFGERCARVAVRGPYTAAVLERYGIRNFEVLGCPSNFINPDQALGAGILARWRSGGREAFAYAPTFYSYNAAVERGIYDALGPRAAEIVAQDPMPAVALARGDLDAVTLAWLTEKAGFLSALPQAERGRAVAMLRAYFCAEAWMEAYRRVDGVVGTRIHGANLAWQAGRAALVVSFDLRTEELADTMGVPMVKADRLDPARVLEAMDERVDACAAGFDMRRAGLAAGFVALVEAHGLRPSEPLRRLSVAPGKTIPAASSGGAATTTPVRVWGFLEQYNRRRVAGWVASTASVPPRIVVRFDGREAGVARIAAPRPEVGPNAWTFEFAVPPEVLLRDVMRVEAVAEETGVQLQNSPVVTSLAEADDRKVLRGKDGWLFLQNDTNGVIDQVTGRRRLSAAELEAWARFFRSLDAAASARSATAVYLVAPNKECVLAEALPDGLSMSEERPVRQLQDLVSGLGLASMRFVYPLDALRRAPGPHAVYPKGDSHWSDYGALVALEELLATAVEAIPGPRGGWGMGDLAVEYRNTDLLSKLGGTCIEAQPVLRRRFAVELTTDNRVLNTGRRREYRSRAANAAGRLLLVHDSFGEWLIPHLAERFAATTAIWGSAVPEEALEDARPSAIVVERAERFLIVPPAFRREALAA